MQNDPDDVAVVCVCLCVCVSVCVHISQFSCLWPVCPYCAARSHCGLLLSATLYTPMGPEKGGGEGGGAVGGSADSTF